MDRDSDSGITRVFFFTSFRGGFVNVVRSLVSACPESVNDVDYGSRTPLHCAASHGWEEVATHLLQHGAEVDYR